MTDDSFQIRASNRPHNMAPWCEEKSEHVLKGLVRLLELAEELKSRLSDEDFERMTCLISSIMWDATKLLAFSTGGDWTTDDRSLLMQRRGLGLFELLRRYRGLTQGRTITRLDDFTNRLRECLSGFRSPGRTLINDLLDSCHPELAKHALIRSISKLTDDLNMGKVSSWQIYVNQVEDVLVKHFDSQQMPANEPLRGYRESSDPDSGK